MKSLGNGPVLQGTRKATAPGPSHSVYYCKQGSARRPSLWWRKWPFALLSILLAGVIFNLLPVVESSRTKIPPTVASLAPQLQRGNEIPRWHKQLAARKRRPSTQISGRVTDKKGKAIARARVCWAAAEAQCIMASCCVFTDSEGEFRIIKAPPSASTVFASAPGYALQQHMLEGSTQDQRSKLILELPRGKPGIWGHVTDALGGTIVGADIQAYREQGPIPLGRTVSGSDGSFILRFSGREEEDFPLSGSTTLSVGAFGYSRSTQMVLVPARDVTITLAPSSQMGGRVVDSKSLQPISDVQVTASGQNGLYQNLVAKSGSDGTFNFQELPGGRYRVSVQNALWRSDGTLVSVPVGGDITDVLIHAVPAGSLGGTIKVGGDSCDQGAVWLKTVDGTLQQAQLQGGSYRLEGLRPGRYEVFVTCSTAVAQNTNIVVEAGEQERDWDLDGGLVLSGTASRSGGRPFAGALITMIPRARETEDNMALFSGRSVQCRAGDDGAFRCLGLRPGDYECMLGSAGAPLSEPLLIPVQEGGSSPLLLSAQAVGSVRLIPADPSIQSAVFARRTSRVEPGTGRIVSARMTGDFWGFRELPLGEYDILLGSADTEPMERVQLRFDEDLVEVRVEAKSDGWFSGFVFSEDGSPEANTWVRFYSSQTLRASGAVLTDVSGQFDIGGLPEGAYLLRVTGDRGEANVGPIRVGTADVQIQLESFVSLEGLAKTADGQLVDAFIITYSDQRGVMGTVTGSNGHWTIPWVRSGSVSLELSSSAGSTRTSLEVTGDDDDYPQLLTLVVETKNR